MSAPAATRVVGFVDSYTSTMITGSVMRPITDEFDILREKLAYLLDSTISPTASVAVVSTWLGFEVAAYVLSEHVDVGQVTVYDNDADLGVSDD